MNKWILSLVIVLSPCLSYGSAYVPCSAAETANNTCFECGATCTIRYSEQQKDDNTTEKILTVSGQGAMKDYHLLGVRPWSYKGSEVTKVVVEEGITSVGYDGFLFFDKLTDVELPTSLLSLEPGAFQGCSNLTSLNLPDGVDIKAASLDGNGLRSIVIPENAKLSGGEGIFKYVVGAAPLEKIYCLSAQKDACAEAVSYRGDDVNVISYDKQDGVYIIKDENDNDLFYTSANDMEQGNNACQSTDINVCKAKVLENKGICHNEACLALVNAAISGKLLKVGSKTYQSLNALLKGNYDKRRIYTIEEANFVAGDKNRVSIRYK